MEFPKLTAQEKKFNTSFAQSVDEFTELVGWLSCAHCTKLPSVPSFKDPIAFKKFCSGLLEGDGNHPWKLHLSSLPRRISRSVAASLFLFRKKIPSSTIPGVGDYVTRMSAPDSRPPTDDFKLFASKYVRRIFRAGWDRGYAKKVSSSVLPPSAVLECKRRDGGARALPSSFQDAINFREKALGLQTVEPSPRVKASVVETGGKHRVVTVGSVDRTILRPLHHVIYDHLSKQDWLLRGEAKPKSFDTFSRKRGEVFVSGDYESATDNLSLSFYQHLLREVLATAKNVPSTVKEFALGCSASTFVTLDKETLEMKEVGRQRRGQLMGNYLSFPFLCLVNYLTFKYFVRRKVPVKINGDDIVFRGTVSEYERWAAGVGESGLVLSKGKTLVSKDFFSLNSSFWQAGAKKVYRIPYIRSTCAFGTPESLSDLVGRYKDAFPGFCGDARRFLQTSFLCKNRKLIYRSSRSLTRGLGLRVPRSVLLAAGLSDREDFYLRLPRESPPPPSPTDSWTIPVPGWSCVPMVSEGGFQLSSRKWRSYAKEMEGRWFQDGYAHIWSGGSSAEVLSHPAAEWRAYWHIVRSSGAVYRRRVHRSLTRFLFIQQGTKVRQLSMKRYREWIDRGDAFLAAAEPAKRKCMWQPIGEFSHLEREGCFSLCDIDATRY